MNRMRLFALLLMLVPSQSLALSADGLKKVQYDAVYYDSSTVCGTPDNTTGAVTTTKSLTAFVDAYGQMAYDNSIHTGVPYEFTLGQAIIESGYGQSKLTTEANNFFGIKAGGSWTGATIVFPTKEFVGGSYITVNATFRKYSSPQDSFADHDNLLRNSSRYAAAFQYSGDPIQFLVEIKKGGYATDPNYVQTVGAVIRGVQQYIASKSLWPPSSQVKYDLTTVAPVTGPVGESTNSCTAPPSSISGYSNPMRGVQSLGRARIDMGVDYTGEGPIYAIGNGTVTVARSNTGWPGGNFISYQLTDGPAAGKYVYVAENCPVEVHVGDKVNANTVLCSMHNHYPFIETGWAATPPSDTAAAHTVYHEGHVTAYGMNFSQLLERLGAPPGIQDKTTIVGSLPAGWPTW